MKILFCCEPGQPKVVDEVYTVEATAAGDAGFEIELVDFEALVDDDEPERAVRRVGRTEAETPILYRGWMLRVEQYRKLHQALVARGLTLVNTPEQYETAHHLPSGYSLIESQTPKTIWIPCEAAPPADEILDALRVFGGAPVVLKDYVKSQKHYWEEACFIANSSDRAAVQSVVGKFVELQGDDLQGGLVFREFVELEPLGTHSKSQMPLTLEYRLFVVGGVVIATLPYWEEGTYSAATPPPTLFEEILRFGPAPFFSMDVAKRLHGDWIVVEMGDGQVTGLPERADVGDFYRSLAAASKRQALW